MQLILFAILFVLLAIWLISFTFTFRSQIPSMTGMMSAMTLGMTVGLVLGSMIPLWLPGLFFQSTVVSMMIGGLAGVIIGWPISLMAVLDGLLSGMMGGMMGAMLMFMMPEAYISVTVKIISILCSGILYVLFIMLQAEVGTELLKQRSFLVARPAPMFFVILVLLVIGLQVPTDTRDARSPLANLTPDASNTKHHHGNSALPEQHYDNADQELRVTASEFTFVPNNIQVRANQPIRLTLHNSGQMEHDFEVVGTDIHIHAAAGKQISNIVQFTEPGTYEVICTLPGHQEPGMTATIQVDA
ncbi:cupredoxin domain-containing protein [Paenibacillus guangzhouensis]|uniref:cupredoxin domain-containing protein n=1 Tax=Paenibacillus guangzhouensis TaxID=1473112 RepID=UPI001266BF3D|nr:cupredoxin domain-containing protein [Paenibacillus guangzhouensis]